MAPLSVIGITMGGCTTCAQSAIGVVAYHICCSLLAAARAPQKWLSRAQASLHSHTKWVA